MKVSQSERYEKVLKSIAGSDTKEQLQVCSKLVESFSRQISESDKTPMVKASLDGMIVLREYQIQIK